jgi:hypothetical protein
MATDIRHDCFVHLVAAGAHGRRIGQPAQREHGDFGCASADVHNHRSAGNANHNLGIAEQLALAVHFLDKMLDHLLGHIDVRDHAIAQRPNGFDAVRRFAHHHLRVIADGFDFFYTVDGFNRDNRWFVENDSLAACINHRIRSAEVDRQILRTELEQIFKHICVRNFLVSQAKLQHLSKALVKLDGSRN